MVLYYIDFYWYCSPAIHFFTLRKIIVIGIHGSKAFLFFINFYLFTGATNGGFNKLIIILHDILLRRIIEENIV